MHHHHHYTGVHSSFHHHHHAHHFSSSTASTTNITMANRGAFLAMSIVVSVLITLGATGFLVLTFTLFASRNAFPKFFLVPFAIIASLMIVVAIVSLIRAIHVYRKAPAEVEKKIEEGEEEPFENEAE